MKQQNSNLKHENQQREQDNQQQGARRNMSDNNESSGQVANKNNNNSQHDQDMNSGNADHNSGGGNTNDPKRQTGDNTIKNPDDWTTGDEPMTGAQSSYLHTLASEAGVDIEENLTKAAASKKIDELQHKTGRGLEGTDDSA